MQYRTKNKFVFLFFVSMLSMLSLYAEKVPLSFDTLFPSSCFKEACDSCVQAWANLNLFQDCNKNTMYDHGLLIDAIIGQLAYAYFCLKDMYNTKDFISIDDVRYLKQIIARIQENINVSNGNINDRISYVKKISNKIALFLHQIDTALQPT